MVINSKNNFYFNQNLYHIDLHCKPMTIAKYCKGDHKKKMILTNKNKCMQINSR